MTILLERGVDLIEINVDEGDVEAQRFYERHGFSATESGSTERAFYYSQELATRGANPPDSQLHQSMMLPSGPASQQQGHRAVAAPKIARDRHQ